MHQAMGEESGWASAPTRVTFPLRQLCSMPLSVTCKYKPLVKVLAQPSPVLNSLSVLLDLSVHRLPPPGLPHC